jgi:hypothetical protein
MERERSAGTVMVEGIQIGLEHKDFHTADDLASVGGMPVGDPKAPFCLIDPVGWDLIDFCAGVVDDDGERNGGGLVGSKSGGMDQKKGQK